MLREMGGITANYVRRTRDAFAQLQQSSHRARLHRREIIRAA